MDLYQKLCINDDIQKMYKIPRIELTNKEVIIEFRKYIAFKTEKKDKNIKSKMIKKGGNLTNEDSEDFENSEYFTNNKK